MNPELDLPPAAFINVINRQRADRVLREDFFEYHDWRRSPEWRVFMAGYNDAIETCVTSIYGRKNMGMCDSRLYSEKIP